MKTAYRNPVQIFVTDSDGKPLPCIEIKRVINRAAHGSYIIYMGGKIAVTPADTFGNLYEGYIKSR